MSNRDGGMSVSTNESSSSLTEYETGICRSLAYFVNATTELVQTELALGPGIESLIKLLTKFYTTAGQLSKYFYLRCKTMRESIKSSRFDTLLDRVGRDLTKNIYEFINQIQQLETDESTATLKEKKVTQSEFTSKIVHVIYT